MRLIIIVGQPSSGKDTAARYIVSRHGFAHISSGDFIRRDMERVGLPSDRPAMREFAEKMRAERGMHYPTDEIAAAIAGDTVISGFRNMAGVEYIKRKFPGNSVIIALTVPIEIRFERAQNRGRGGDRISFAAFKEQEERERAGGPAHELDRVIVLADQVIENDGSEAELFYKIDTIVGTISGTGEALT